MLSVMTAMDRCAACEGRGWVIVTRRGQVAASRLGMAQSAQRDCLSCEGPDPRFVPGEMFDWEVFIDSRRGDEIGPCGSTSYQATSMDELRTAMRKLAPDTSVWGRITHKVFD